MLRVNDWEAQIELAVRHAQPLMRLVPTRLQLLDEKPGAG